MRVAAAAFPFALPARYAGDARADDQVVVTCCGETVVYASAADLRVAVLAPGVRTPFAPAAATPWRASRTVRLFAAILSVGLTAGALAGFAAFGLAELHRAGIVS